MKQFDELYNDPSYIILSDNRKIIALKENGRIYRAYNTTTKKIKVYQVDGGMISSEACKCDKAVFTEDNSLYFIELKGSDFAHAVEQILSALDILFTPELSKPSSVHGRIVLSKARIPDIRTSKVTRLEQKLKKMGGTLLKQSVLLEENI